MVLRLITDVIHSSSDCHIRSMHFTTRYKNNLLLVSSNPPKAEAART